MPLLLSPSLQPRADARAPAILRLATLAFLGIFASCNPKGGDDRSKPAPHEKGALFRVGAITVYQADLDRELQEKKTPPTDEAAKKKAIDELVTRAQFVHAAVEAGLDKDPAIRAQFARALATRLKEQTLLPRLKEMSAPIPEARLRELYHAGGARFRSDEKRQIAVLWLNHNGAPERGKQYEEKLAAAREWLFANGDLKDHPEQGFSALSVDHSEHAASRYKGGVLGWLERQGGMDAWSKAVAEIAFSLKEPGEVSATTVRPEGVFLIRLMAIKPAVVRPFEAVSGELDRSERQRIRAAMEADFEASIKAKHPVQWLAP